MWNKQQSFQFQFAAKFEDKCSLIFLILIPIFEIIRNLINVYGVPKPLQQLQSRWLTFVSPPNNKQNNIFSYCSKPLLIFKKIFKMQSLKLCSRRTQKKNDIDLETAPLIIQLDDHGMNTDTDIELGLHSASPKVRIESSTSFRSQNGTKNTAKIFWRDLDKTTTNNNKKADKVQVNKMNLESLNTYDLFKVFSTITMFIDHYAYFGLPGLTSSQSRWFRVIGRTAAPGFFFLAGYSSKRFRLRIYFGALFLYFFTAVVPVKMVHSPWESIMNVALINCVFYYLPPHCFQNVLVHAATFGVLQYYRQQWSQANIGYGTIPIILAIAGDLMRHKHYLRYIWVIAGMISFAVASKNVFAANTQQTAAIYLESTFNALIMCCFTIIELPTWNKNPFTKFYRNAFQWLSRNGLIVYIFHLCLFRTIQLCYFSGQFNHLYA